MQPSPFQFRGVVEGFYGVYYTFPERNDLIDFIGRHGYNFYLYGPKNDRQHRARWWDPYPDEIVEQFAETVARANAAGVTFCYAISPISYASDEDFEKITAKLRIFYGIGVRSFSVLMDDVTPTFDHELDQKGYQLFAEAHVNICNRLYEWLQALDPACTLSMCPVDYHGTAPFGNYLRVLGERLHPDIDIFYTGPQICTPTIAAADAAAFAQVVHRAPVIWDNYPVNDLAMRSEMHVGPITGREASLCRAVKGVVVNPMIQTEASKIALLTYADYMRDPDGYDPACSWERALLEIGGRKSFEALSRFAENSLHSCLHAPDAPKLESLVQAAIAALRRGERYAGSEAIRALEGYLNNLDEAGYFLKNRMTNLQLRDDLLPWIEALEDWVWMGKRALRTLAALDRDEPYRQPAHAMEQSLQEIAGHNKRSGGRVLQPLADYVHERVQQREREEQWVVS